MTRQFIESTHEAYYRHLGEYFGGTIQSIFYDEASPYACGNFSWTESFPAVFLKEKGYDIVGKLPHLFFDGGGETAKVRCDYWDVATKLFAQGFVGQIADWCGEHGIALTGHTHEDSNLWPVSGNPYRTLRAQQWVGLDSLLGYKPYSCLKLAVSAAHVSGGDMVVCEALGILGGWECTPAMMKKAYNQLAVAGVNLLVPHGFFETVENPKAECPPSFFACNPYWQMYEEISAMTDLQCYINRKMAHVADIAVFYPIVSWQARGRGGRGRTSPCGIEAGRGALTAEEWGQFDRIVDVLMGEQLDMDILDDVALEEGRMAEGSLSVGRERYRALVLPRMSTVRLADVSRILQLAEEGLTVLASEGFAPSATAENGAGDARLLEIMERLEGHLHRFREERELVEDLRQLIHADIYVESGERAALDAAHRRLGEVDLYLLSHTGQEAGEYRVSVGCRNREHALLDCRGRRFPAAFSEDGERTEVCFLAEPEEIYYFVLSEEKADSAVSGKGHVLTSAQWEKLPMVQELQEFRFLPWPEGLEGRADGSAYVDMLLPVCKTLELPYESADGERLASVWEHWMEPGFDDGEWEVLSLKHGPKLYDHTGSRMFRFVLPTGTAAVRRPIPVNGEYALYLNGQLIEAVTGHAPEPADGEERWIMVEGCEEGPGILAIECSSMAPQFGLLSPMTVRIQAYRTAPKDWKELGLGWYAGYGRYETEFEYRALREGEALWLDLGQVRECAAVFLNGRKVGQKLWKPYRFDLSQEVREGKNTLTIYSCNLIANEFAWDPLGTRGSASCLPSGIIGNVGLYLEEG